MQKSNHKPSLDLLYRDALMIAECEERPEALLVFFRSQDRNKMYQAIREFEKTYDCMLPETYLELNGDKSIAFWMPTRLLQSKETNEQGFIPVKEIEWLKDQAKQGSFFHVKTKTLKELQEAIPNDLFHSYQYKAVYGKAILIASTDEFSGHLLVGFDENNADARDRAVQSFNETYGIEIPENYYIDSNGIAGFWLPTHSLILSEGKERMGKFMEALWLKQTARKGHITMIPHTQTLKELNERIPEAIARARASQNENYINFN